MRKVTFAAIQMSMTDSIEENYQKTERLIRKAAAQGAQVVLPSELFLGPYFCKVMNKKYFALAMPAKNNPWLAKMAALAKELKIVIPVSFFEEYEGKYFNSIMMIDADGRELGLYRKSHIPEGPGYNEKFYFSPGDTGYRVFKTRYGILGVGICWDQWFSEVARSMTRNGADVLLYPTAIGSEPVDTHHDSMRQWQRVMQGHAAGNTIPVIAANRVGVEKDKDPETGEEIELTFYGSSFITDGMGERLKKANRTEETILLHTFDLDETFELRKRWGLFRDPMPHQKQQTEELQRHQDAVRAKL
jgi:N-carbamoylputrescine amidase